MRAYEFLIEEELDEYAFDYRQRLASTAYIAPKVGENKKYYKLWKKAYHKRNMSNACSFCDEVIRKILKKSTIGFGTNKDDLYDMMFTALSNVSTKYEDILKYIDSEIDAYNKREGFKKPTDSLPVRIGHALTSFL